MTRYLELCTGALWKATGAVLADDTIARRTLQPIVDQHQVVVTVVRTAGGEWRLLVPGFSEVPHG